VIGAITADGTARIGDGPLLADQRRSQYAAKLTCETVCQGRDKDGNRVEACWDE
jgi:hypothetical protein